MKATHQQGNGTGGVRKWASLLALAAGALVLSTPGFAEARCTTKPAVCARLAAQKAQHAKWMAKPAVKPVQQRVAAVQATPQCKTKPAVCARLRHTETPAVRTPWVPQRRDTRMAGETRCKTKPAVCARLRATSEIWM